MGRATEVVSDKALLIEALKGLKAGALLALFAVVVPTIVVVPTTLSGTIPVEGAVPGAILVFTVFEIAAIILWLRATGKLREFDSQRLGIGRSGLMLHLIGLVIIVVDLLFLFVLAAIPYGAESTKLTPIILVLISALLAGAVLIVIGIWRFGTMLIRLSEIEGIEDGFKVAGILYMVAWLLKIIKSISINTSENMIGDTALFVALILIYTYSKRSIEKLQATSQPSSPNPESVVRST